MEIIRTEKSNDNLFSTSVMENLEDLFSLIVKPKKDMTAEIKKSQEQTKELNDVTEKIEYMVDKVVRSEKRISVSCHFEERFSKLINSILKEYESVVNYKSVKSTSIKGGIDYIVWTKD